MPFITQFAKMLNKNLFMLNFISRNCQSFDLVNKVFQTPPYLFNYKSNLLGTEESREPDQVGICILFYILVFFEPIRVD